MKVLDFYYFEISTYILIIGIAFLISFIVFYKISKNNYDKLDIMYIYIINIVGFAIGSKLMSLISNNITITLYNFINSGYSFLGGIIGSILAICFYCKRYKLDFVNILSSFMVIYPLIYSISKIGCFLNGCCYGIIRINDINYNFPLPLFDAAIMFILFLILLKQNTLTINMLFGVFYIVRFLEDYFREFRNIYFFNLTLDQILCVISLIILFFVIIFVIFQK